MQQNITIFEINVLNIYISNNKENLTYIYLLKPTLTTLSDDNNINRISFLYMIYTNI